MSNVILQLRAGMLFVQNDNNLHFKFFVEIELVFDLMVEHQRSQFLEAHSLSKSCRPIPMERSVIEAILPSLVTKTYSDAVAMAFSSSSSSPASSL